MKKSVSSRLNNLVNTNSTNKMTPMINYEKNVESLTKTVRSYRSCPNLPDPVTVVLMKSEKKAKEIDWKPLQKSKFSFVVDKC